MMQATNVLPLWQQPAPIAIVEPAAVKSQLHFQGKDDNYLMNEDIAQLVSVKTLLIIADCGYCLWRLHKFDGLVICLAADLQDSRVPKGYPCFTPEELDKCYDMELSTFKITCEAKMRGATVVSVDEKEDAQ